MRVRYKFPVPHRNGPAERFRLVQCDSLPSRPDIAKLSRDFVTEKPDLVVARANWLDQIGHFLEEFILSDDEWSDLMESQLVQSLIQAIQSGSLNWALDIGLQSLTIIFECASTADLPNIHDYLTSDAVAATLIRCHMQIPDRNIIDYCRAILALVHVPSHLHESGANRVREEFFPICMYEHRIYAFDDERYSASSQLICAFIVSQLSDSLDQYDSTDQSDCLDESDSLDLSGPWCPPDSGNSPPPCHSFDPWDRAPPSDSLLMFEPCCSPPPCEFSDLWDFPLPCDPWRPSESFNSLHPPERQDSLADFLRAVLEGILNRSLPTENMYPDDLFVIIESICHHHPESCDSLMDGTLEGITDSLWLDQCFPVVLQHALTCENHLAVDQPESLRFDFLLFWDLCQRTDPPIGKDLFDATRHIIEGDSSRVAEYSTDNVMRCVVLSIEVGTYEIKLAALKLLIALLVCKPDYPCTKAFAAECCRIICELLERLDTLSDRVAALRVLLWLAQHNKTPDEQFAETILQACNDNSNDFPSSLEAEDQIYQIRKCLGVKEEEKEEQEEEEEEEEEACNIDIRSTLEAQDQTQQVEKCLGGWKEEEE
jgi:hypothetical protein